MSEKDKKGVVTNQQVLQVAENASKGVSDLSKVIAEVQKAAEQIKNLNHPVLNTGEAKNHFNQMITSAETLKNMNGRWINGSQEIMVKLVCLLYTYALIS